MCGYAQAVIRERHCMPTLEELIHDLNGAVVLSQLDLRSGYHHLDLDLDLEISSRYITIFSIHCGCFRYKFRF